MPGPIYDLVHRTAGGFGLNVGGLARLGRDFGSGRNVYGGGGAGVSDIGGGLQVTNLSREGFWIKITSGTNPYAWTAVYESSPGTWADWSGLSGTTTVNPAYELNANASVAANTRVWAEIGTDGTSLVFDASSSTGGGSVPTFSGARVINDAALSINDATLTTLTFNTEYFDTDAYHSTSSNTDRMTAPTLGKYMVGACALFDANATGYRFVGLYHQGSTMIASQQAEVGSAAGAVIVSTIYEFTAGQYFNVKVYQTSGGALNVTQTDAASPVAWMYRIGQ